ncbi:PPP4R4 [Cordylochernes scorpioides]|uniref:PPP4R4 n=1 Tax=Cordylochernes scorpioides TaxID=51811 RepID=A0ABY6K6M9_9ARAC|nr:PPP4R4 [Cordylochernes scorpioides]
MSGHSVCHGCVAYTKLCCATDPKAGSEPWTALTACILPHSVLPSSGKVVYQVPALRVSSSMIKKEIVPMVQCLCQDVNPDVRATMCSQLDFVARGIGLETSRSAVLPELVELAQDEAAGVRRAAVRALAAMAPLLSHEDGRTTLAPLLRKCCSQALASLDPLVLPCLARALGALCRALAGNSHCNLMPDLVPQAEKSDLCLECRIACAFNMPAMAQFAGPSLFSDHLASLFSELCADPNPQVRAMMAAGFPEVQVCAGGASLLRELLTLLRDSSLQVIQSGLLEQLPRCVEAVPWASLSHTERKETAGDLVQALLACEATLVSSYKWRLHAQLLSQLATLPERLPPSVVQPMLGPFLLSRVLTLRPLPCRLTAGYALLMLLRSCPTLAQRIALVTRIDAVVKTSLLSELCRGQSCHHRMLYVRLCELATQIFSWSFFRTHFFSPLLSLAGDGVANIRLRLCSLLAPLKACMQLPADSQLLAALEACVRRLMAAERDRDVMAALCHVSGLSVL